MSIRLINGRLKGPSPLALNGITIRRDIGGEVHEWYRRFVPGTGPGNRILHSLVYREPETVVIISLDEMEPHGVLLHASISHPDRYPLWETIKALKAAVFGDTDVMMVLPRQKHYVNVHRYAFHLWQMPVEWGIT